jgi:hypothetical protein
MKKLVFVAALVVLVGGGAFAQLAFGVTGALHMDQQLSASEISTDFKTGDNIYYGGFVEYLFRHVGLGVSVNVSPAESLALELINYDANLYLSYHLFRATAFLDPFGEVGFGAFALDYKNSADRIDGGTSPIAESPYWYAALGLGVNLGRHVGVFGKFAYNMLMQRHATDKDSGQEIPYYGNYSQDANGDWVVTEYVPAYRFTLGLKLIL